MTYHKRIDVLIAAVAVVRVNGTYTTLTTERVVVEPESGVGQVGRNGNRQKRDSRAIASIMEAGVESIDSGVGIVGRKTGCGKQRLNGSVVSLSNWRNKNVSFGSLPSRTIK